MEHTNNERKYGIRPIISTKIRYEKTKKSENQKIHQKTKNETEIKTTTTTTKTQKTELNIYKNTT
jgi:hypothetical protein